MKVSLEAILLSLYAWNSAPVVGTDFSRSLLTVGREFSWPIDFSTEKLQALHSPTSSVQNFAEEQAFLLSHSKAIA